MPTILAALIPLFFAPQDLQTTPGTTVSGRVIDLRGEGVPAAPVWIIDPDDAAELARSATDAEGFFRLGGIAIGDGYVRVHASAPGMSRDTGWARRDDPTVALELHDATTVRGVLVDGQGKPVPDAVVGAAPAGRALSGSAVHGTTDEDGAFAIENVPLGWSSVSAWVPGEGVAMALHRVQGDDEISLRPSAEPTTTARIEIVGWPEQDQPRLTLSLLPYKDGSLRYLPEPYERPVLTGTTWEAAPIPDWRYSVRLSAAGYTFEPNQARWDEGKGPHTTRFVATRLGSARLSCPAIVRDAEGDPVAGVSFVFRRSNGGPRARATSDAEGKLVFESPLAAGTPVVVYCTNPEWVVDQEKVGNMHGTRDRRFLEDHETAVDPDTTLELRVAPACSVRGRVVHADGRPAGHVSVKLEGSHPSRMPQWMSFAYATTDRDGRFEFAGRHHAADDVRVSIESDAGFYAGQPFLIDEAGTVVDVGQLELSPPATIEGVIADANGQPVPGIAVWLRDWDMNRGQQRSGSVTEVITDRQGRYRFRGVPLGGAWLQLASNPAEWNHKQVVQPFEVEPGETYEFRIELPR